MVMSTTRTGTILVIDDEEVMREILETLLTREGYDVRLASSGGEGLELARALPFDAAIVDIMMPGLDGIATLDELKRIDEDLAVIIITAYASVESAISAMKSGAFDYITKPFKNEEVLVVASSDMSHYLPDEVTRKIDQRALEPLLQLDAAALYRRVRDEDISMCGILPATAMVAYAVARGAKSARLLKYATSGDAFGDRSAVVGYAGVLIS